MVGHTVIDKTYPGTYFTIDENSLSLSMKQEVSSTNCHWRELINLGRDFLSLFISYLARMFLDLKVVTTWVLIIFVVT